MGVQLSDGHGLEMRSDVKNKDLVVIVIEANQILLGCEEISDGLS
jgi:hypothetical protein